MQSDYVGVGEKTEQMKETEEPLHLQAWQGMENSAWNLSKTYVLLIRLLLDCVWKWIALDLVKTLKGKTFVELFLVCQVLTNLRLWKCEQTHCSLISFYSIFFKGILYILI